MGRVRATVLRRTATVAVLCISMMSLLAFVPTQSATAYPNNQRSSNLAGGSGLSGSQNWPFAAQYAWQNWLGGYQAYGMAWPLAIGLQEACWKKDGPIYDGSANGLFQDVVGYLVGSLLYVTGGGYTAYEADENGLHPNDPGSSCWNFGNVAIGRANNVFSGWRAGEKVDYIYHPAPPSDSSGPRNITCVYPTIWIVNFASCTTHLTHKDDNRADQQLGDAVSYQNGIIWSAHPDYKSFFTGDFNISVATHATGNIWNMYLARNPEEACRAGQYYLSWGTPYTRSAISALTEKVDYVWGRNAYPSPVQCNNDFIHSDHLMVTGLFE